jgi:hypothetical protein
MYRIKHQIYTTAPLRNTYLNSNAKLVLGGTLECLQNSSAEFWYEVIRGHRVKLQLNSERKRDVKTGLSHVSITKCIYIHKGGKFSNYGLTN